KYWDPKSGKLLALGTPQTAFPGIADVIQFQTARGSRPGRDNAYFLPQQNWSRFLRDDDYALFLRGIAQRPIPPRPPGSSTEPHEETPLERIRRLRAEAEGTARQDTDVTVIVMTDRLADEVPDANGATAHRISDGEVDKILNDPTVKNQGIRWVLV